MNHIRHITPWCIGEIGACMYSPCWYYWAGSGHPPSSWRLLWVISHCSHIGPWPSLPQGHLQLGPLVAVIHNQTITITELQFFFINRMFYVKQEIQADIFFNKYVTENKTWFCCMDRDVYLACLSLFLQSFNDSSICLQIRHKCIMLLKQGLQEPNKWLQQWHQKHCQ